MEASTEANVLKPNEILKNVNVGNYLSLKIKQYYEDLPQIGKVVKINDSSVTVDWLVGSYSGTFGFWRERGKVIREVYPLRGIMCHLKLTPAMKLTKVNICSLKKTYLSAEFV